MKIPESIDRILATLDAAGHCAYVVGGCVRDMLMGRAIHDWDIASSARPEQVMELFDRTIPTGLAHGTVTVRMDDMTAEVTTFRREDGYADGRHPVHVEFVDALQEDLSRRDFTINAMAMDRNGVVTDLFGGREDIQAACIRCVGDPCARFEEDALRMFRALRFSAQLNFAIEHETAASIRTCAPRCALLSVERIRDELEKTLCSQKPQVVGDMVSLGMLAHLELTAAKPLPMRAGLSDAPEVRWALFAAAYGCEILRHLRLPRRIVQISTAAALQLRQQPLPMLRLLARLGEPAARCYAELTGQLPELQQTLAGGACWNFRMMAVHGADFPQIQGPKLGQLLNRLLEHVLEHPQDNRRDVLLSLAAEIINGGME